MSDERAREAQRIIAAIHPLLAGKDPDVQGAVLADLVATFLAGHLPRDLREELLQLHIETVRKLILVNEKLLHGDTLN